MGEQVAAGLHGGVAQLGEHLPCKQGVKSSNLSVSICTSRCAQVQSTMHPEAKTSRSRAGTLYKFILQCL